MSWRLDERRERFARCSTMRRGYPRHEYTTGFRTLVKMKGCPCPTQSPISWRALCTALSRCRRTHWLEFAQFRRSRKRNSSAVKLPLWLFCWLEITSRYSLAGGVQRFHKLQRLRSSANAKRAHSHSNLSSASKFTQFRCSRLGLKRLLQSAHKRSAKEAYGSIRWRLLASLMTIR